MKIFKTARALPALLAVLVLSGCVDPQQTQYNAAMRQLSEGKLAAAVKGVSALAQNGHAASQFRLGVLRLHGIGVPPDPARAAYWFDKAARQDYLPGRYSLARVYLTGVGVAKNPQLALQQLLPLAEREYAPAQLQLGLMYDAGIGTERDLKAAEHWVRRAAENQHPQAVKAMAEAYQRGLLGLDKDPQLARQWRDKGKRKYF